MKNAFAIMMISLLVPASANAAGLEAVIQGSDHACVSGIEGDVCSHFFGGSDVTINLAFGGAGCGQMKSALMQMSTRLEAPIEGAVTPATFDGCKPATATVHLPEVKSEAEFHVVFTVDGKPAEVVVPIKAYPRDILDPLKDWVKDERDVLIVKDKDGKLKDFLDRNKIEYAATAGTKSRKVTIVVADPEDMKEEKPDGNVMYLAEKVKDVSMVTVERTQQGVTATANLKLIDGLTADDPLAERAFMKIFNAISK